MSGLVEARHPGQMPTVITPRFQACVWEATRRKPKDVSTHWSVRKLVGELDISKDAVHRIWQKAGIKPHRVERYMISDDPDFGDQSCHRSLAYSEPAATPRHFLCRHGTLSLYAALDVKTGKVHGKTAARHSSDELVNFLGQVVSQCQPKQKVNIIVDNLSAHKTKNVSDFLESHPEVKLQFTPTYSSWLNQVEIWFARIERDVIARGIFTSVKDLSRKLLRYIRANSKTARPFQWKYSDTRKGIKLC